MSYYYFAATLPMLALDQPPPFSVEEFRQQCVPHLLPRDMAAMDEALDGTFTADAQHPFNRRWYTTDGHLRNALARERASRLGKDPRTCTRVIKGSDTALDRDVSDAYTRPTPLEREKAIDRIRWRRLEEIAGFDPFTADAILAYGVQLAILERWARMDKESGASAVETLVKRTPADEEEKS